MPRLTMRPFEPQDATTFRELNEAWTTKLFVIEPKDRVTLDDPQARSSPQAGTS